METEILTANHRSNTHLRLLPAVAPVLLIAIGYLDPGKWASSVEGGARFGVDLVPLMLVFNFGAILCQYLSAHIAVVSGRDLAQICSMEYDKPICISLGVQTELSMILWDLTMILGTAHGLNLILGLDLFTCVFLTIIEAFLFPLSSVLLESGRAKLLCICITSFILICYICGVLICQPEIPVSMNGMLTKLTGESAFALMSLLGANIVPHNFYLHSSLVQQDLGPLTVSKEAVCLDHLFAILCIFSGVFLVNYVLMNSAANVFYSTGLVLLNFQDALSLMDQALRSPIVPLSLLVVLFFSNQIMALTWSLGRQAILHDFFRMDIPGWLHHATIRALAIIPALYCVWHSGAEGIYQVLIFSQVMVALLLPSSVIPLFRVASSRSIMGIYKISQFVEFLAFITFIGMLGLEIVFLVEMMSGNSDWVGNLRWNVGNGMSIPYALLLITASGSLCLMLWLAATPLKSASSRLDVQALNLDIQSGAQESLMESHNSDFHESGYENEQSLQKHEPELASQRPSESRLSTLVTSSDMILPDTLLCTDSIHLTPVEENSSSIMFPSPSVPHSEDSATKLETVHIATVCNEVFDGESLDNSMLKLNSEKLIEKAVRVEGDSQNEIDDAIDTWDEESAKGGVSLSSRSLTSEGPGSFRSLSGKSDDTGGGPGSGTGSLSRLAGLGRAARRQLAAVLDEFWGQLYDFHGQATQESKARKLDMLLGAESTVSPKPAATVKAPKEPPGFHKSVVRRGSESVMNSSLYDSPRRQGLQHGMESPYGVHRGSPSLRSNHMQLDEYVQNSTRNALNISERSNSTLYLPPTSDGYDYQPATVHGYQIASYLGRIAKEKSSDYVNGQMESLTPDSSSLSTSNYRDPLGFALEQNLPNAANPAKSQRIPSLSVSRNSFLQSERPFYDNCSAPADDLGNPASAKKFHSLPDISGLLPQRDTYLSERSIQWDGPVGYGPSVGRRMHGQSLYSGTSARTKAPFMFDEFSPLKVCKDAFSLQFGPPPDTGSLWSRQPFEQFGLSEKARNIGADGDGDGGEKGSTTGETLYDVDSEARLLKSFRHCILKLLKIEGSDWLFRQNDGADEDLIDRVAARERFLYEAETREMNRVVHTGDFSYSSDRRPGSMSKIDDIEYTKSFISSVPHCGEGCTWRVDLIVSFGVWCIHRVLELSLLESRPELWGKYTYVLNRLQGIIDPAFSKPRSPLAPCFCLQVPESYQRRSSPPISNGSLPPPVKQVRGKCTTAAMLLDMVKDVEIAISCRKGRTGTAAGDVAFPKGKENLASVLKRYKRRLSNKLAGSHEGGPASRKITSSPYGL